MIRTMCDQDAPAVHEIITSSLGYSCDEDVVRANINELASDDHYLSLVCEDDETHQVVGFLHAARYDTLHKRGGWDVISLAVLPSRQGEGHGRDLLDAFEQEVRKRGGRYIRLNSRVERVKAHRFYEHLGYDCDKQQKRFIKQL